MWLPSLMGDGVMDLIKSQSYTAAIEKARAELLEVERKLVGWQELMKRRDILQATINNLTWLAGEGEAPALTQPAIPGTPAGNGKTPLWETIKVHLSTVGPKTPVEIAAALGKPGKSGAEVVRQALRRRRDIFFKTLGGRYKLRGLNAGQKDEADEKEEIAT